LGELEVDGRIKLKLILNTMARKYDELFWLRTETSSERVNEV
jgi:hypothetical protein